MAEKQKIPQIGAVVSLPDNAHALGVQQVLEQLAVDLQGLSSDAATIRHAEFGDNTLPEPKPRHFFLIFLHQFVNPLIYILLVAAVVSILIGEYSDAGFITGVLLLNAIIGTIQEYSAQQSASALQQLVTHHAHVVRDGDTVELSAVDLVPGDIVLLESGDKVPADLRLVKTSGLEIDESLLTGESIPVRKSAETLIALDAVMADRSNCAYSGTLVTRGRATGVVIATGFSTQLGQIAEAVLESESVKPPLLIRMERFSMRISVLMMLMVVILAVISLTRGMPFTEMLLMAAALAVAAIPEGLPVAMTIALSISMRRMAKRNVIVRKLVTVEALGSCTYIATDKTGTLTVNEITITRLIDPEGNQFEVAGEDVRLLSGNSESVILQSWLQQLGRVAVLCNEAYIGRKNGEWMHRGDPVDIAFLVLAHKLGITRPGMTVQYPELSSIPYESLNQFSAALNRDDDNYLVSVKGAVEKILPMCDSMLTSTGKQPVNQLFIEQQAQQLAQQGYRVMALASGHVPHVLQRPLDGEQLHQLSFIALVGMIDPIRPHTQVAIAACHQAGIEVGMITGDHPLTAWAIGQQLGMTIKPDDVVTGQQVRHAEASTTEIDVLTRDARVFARVEPNQKLSIVQSLQRNGHFVAVTGDGANDAPALRAAQVGVAMGKGGTAVARETADMIITDDNFASIVAGIEEGRIAYGNVRKVILLLLTTGVSELILFTLALLAGLPLPLTAVQLLWLNLVTNGIQDVALAFEPGEGDELQRRPRPPKEPVFNRLMVERIFSVALVIGLTAFFTFQWLLSIGYSLEAARNGVLLLMVLFENVHVFNSRSETRSIFSLNPWRNPFLLFGTLGAQMIHIAAMYTPGIREILDVQPIGLQDWLTYLQLALVAVLVSELHKILWNWRQARLI